MPPHWPQCCATPPPPFPVLTVDEAGGGADEDGDDDDDEATGFDTIDEDDDDAAPGPATQVGTTAGPVGASAMPSSALTQPVRAVKAAGHATCWNVAAGLSAPPNQPKRQLQPGWRRAGREAHCAADERPPYCAPPQLLPYWVWQPLKAPTPPPGIWNG